MKKTYKGELEIDMETGTIYFHGTAGRTILRLKGLPAPIPEKAFYDVLVEAAKVSWEPTEVPIEDLIV
jgi:hypothetical protein